MQNTPAPASSRRGLILATLLLLAVVAAVIGAALSLLSSSPFARAGERTPTAVAAATAAATLDAGGRPSLAISPEEGEPGTRIIAVGRGWRSGDTVRIRLEAPGAENATTQEMASAIVSDRGEFSARFTYPDTRPWYVLPVVQVIAVDETAHQRVATPFRITAAQLMTSTPTPTEMPTATELPPVCHRDPYRAAAAANVDAVSAATDHPTHGRSLANRGAWADGCTLADDRAVTYSRAADRRHRLAWGILRSHQSLRPTRPHSQR